MICTCISRIVVDWSVSGHWYHQIVVFDPECPCHSEGRVVHPGRGATS